MHVQDPKVSLADVIIALHALEGVLKALLAELQALRVALPVKE